jgi:isopropylmalate/homocitrate/citramalate synthase
VKDDVVYLQHILEAIRRIEENTSGGREAFLASHTHQDAVLRNLQTMAEATQRLSPAASGIRAWIGGHFRAFEMCSSTTTSASIFLPRLSTG